MWVSRGRVADTLLPILVSLVFAGLLLAGLEGGLRLAGIGAAEMSRLPYQKVYLPVMQEGRRRDGRADLRVGDIRIPYQSILADKPDNALRVFVFGASATYGLGFSPNGTFSRQLERMLEIAYPQRVVEVVNLGIVAIPSKSVQLLLEDACRHYQPDLVVVYAGNNEFMELHAEKYLEAKATPLSRVRGALAGLHVSRVLNRAIRGSEIPTLDEQDASVADVRQAEHTIIHEIEISPDEIAAVIDQYEENLQAMVRAAQGTRTPLLLMTVASNWRWRGMEDLTDAWVGELLGDGEAATAARYRQAIEVLNRTLASEPALAEYDSAMFRRALAHEALGEMDAARADFLESKNTDPHLRRALQIGNERVRKVARATGTPLLDTVEFLSRNASHGIIGFDEFFDNVHPTPRGAQLVAGEIFRQMQELGVAPAVSSFDLDAYQRQRLQRLETLTVDELAVGEFLGFGFDASRIPLRSTWKYDKLMDVLDERLASDPRDLPALVYRGNMHAFRIEGAGEGERDYRAALEIESGHARVRANLEKLLDQGR